jgi:hypothetical protein
MNERIKELMDKATTIEEYGWGASYENFDREKFAELIVRECCAIADQVERADMDSYVSKYIKAHFGVEE